ncbi:hypothetical protein Purlil1_14301 [Purpureocillium lilacinum]|uniref:Uncharacterized protein n=1 Tax=Purpureocillium lilacinum TaxID=33203 RepID=A0ABR0BBN0_PURLI|nr:hypothetical protein Purlil1_14301 [Purpureocillium lilacinum]
MTGFDGTPWQHAWNTLFTNTKWLDSAVEKGLFPILIGNDLKLKDEIVESIFTRQEAVEKILETEKTTESPRSAQEIEKGLMEQGGWHLMLVFGRKEGVSSHIRLAMDDMNNLKTFLDTVNPLIPYSIWDRTLKGCEMTVYHGLTTGEYFPESVGEDVLDRLCVDNEQDGKITSSCICYCDKEKEIREVNVSQHRNGLIFGLPDFEGMKREAFFIKGKYLKKERSTTRYWQQKV